MDNPFFSVGIPVYNASKYISECLESILSQDYPDFEIILVDDGSTDDSYSLCEQYAKKDYRIKLFRKENGGISSACNSILDNSSGKYFFQMDNDDIMHEGCLKNAYNRITEHDYPDLLQCGYKQFAYDINHHVLDKIYSYPGEDYFSDNYDSNCIKLLSENKYANPLWTKFIKLNFIKENHIRFNSKYDSAQDSDFSLKCHRKTNNIAFGEFYTVNWIHPRDESVSSTRKPAQFIKLMDFHYDYVNDIKNWAVSDEEKNTMTKAFLIPMRHYTLEIFNMPKEEVMKTFDIAQKYFGRAFKKLPLTGVNIDFRANVIYLLYNAIGMKNTARLLYFYLHKIKRR